MAIVLAMIDKESRFDIYAVGDAGRALGLMQIHPRWHMDRMAKLECWDLMDPYQNLTVAVDFIAELAARGNSIEWVLMAYNGGESYADRKVAAGEVSEYAVEVLGMAERYW
jgi:soluble lytic murein transglycosylase-like protein